MVNCFFIIACDSSRLFTIIYKIINTPLVQVIIKSFYENYVKYQSVRMRDF